MSTTALDLPFSYLQNSKYIPKRRSIEQADEKKTNGFWHIPGKVRRVIFHQAADQTNTFIGLGISIITTTGLVIKGVIGLSKREWKHINTVLKGLPYLGFVACLDIPFEINGIVNDIDDFIHGNASEKWDSVLLLLGKIGAIGESISVVAHSIAKIWENTAPALAWATPLGIASGFLSTFTIIYNVKGWIEKSKYLKEFEEAAGLKKNAEQYTVEDYENGLNYLRDKKINHQNFLKQHFKIDEKIHMPALLMAQNNAIDKIDNASPESPEYKAEAAVLREKMKALRSRVQAKIRSSQLAILISTVSLVALSVGVFSPVPLASVCIGGGACLLTVAKIIHDQIAAYRFNKALKIKEEKV
jgi:hypothetical protein